MFVRLKDWSTPIAPIKSNCNRMSIVMEAILNGLVMSKYDMPVNYYRLVQRYLNSTKGLLVHCNWYRTKIFVGDLLRI